MTVAEIPVGGRFDRAGGLPHNLRPYRRVGRCFGRLVQARWTLARTSIWGPVFCFTYWSDPLCIWAYVAQHKLDALMEGKASEPTEWPMPFSVTGEERPSLIDIGDGPDARRHHNKA